MFDFLRFVDEKGPHKFEGYGENVKRVDLTEEEWHAEIAASLLLSPSMKHYPEMPNFCECAACKAARGEK